MSNTTDNTQELDEILFDLNQYRSSRPHSINQTQVMEKRQAIIDWRDKQVEEVTRFEVIDDTGRAYTSHDVSIELSYQDDGRTLKVFVNKLKEAK